MKKLILLTAALLAFCAAKAQFDVNNFTYGAKVGLNATNISNSDMKNKLSFHLGAFAEWKLSDFVGIQPELVYSRQGARDKYDENGSKVKVKTRVNYLNIPILAKLYVLEDLSVDLGPQFGFALNAKSKYKVGGHTSKDKITDNNTFDFSFAVGASYNFDDFIFSARYNIGLSNMWDKDKVGENLKNHVFQLSVGYCLNNLF